MNHYGPSISHFWRMLTRMLLVAIMLALPAAAVAAANSPNAVAVTNTLSSYKLGAGDVINITVFGEDDLSLKTLRLTDAGTVSYPVLGELRILGLTVGDLERQITDGLKGRYLVNPRVSVQIVEYRPFYINGMVEKPGAYPYQPGLTIRTAAALAGGFKETASLDRISVITERDALQKSMTADLNTTVKPGDTIVVPEYQPFYINGMVEKAGAYPYQPGLNVRQAASLAGGFKERASLSKIYVIRASDPAQKPTKAELGTPIGPGDTIVVEDSFF